MTAQDRPHRLLRRVLATDGSPALVEMREADLGKIHLTVHSASPLSQRDLRCVKVQVAHILRLDESLQEFYFALAKAPNNGEFDWIPKVRAGRLLRSPSIFEDIVKMICTTNCAWSATERMVENLVTKLGTRFNHQYSDFPTPQQLASRRRTPS